VNDLRAMQAAAQRIWSPVAGKERVRNRYQDDHEADRLSAERYERRAAQLDEELEALYAHNANLELQMDGTKQPRVPNENELAESGQTPDMADEGLLFASRRPGWS
jgi:hypothetical protein